MKDRGSKTVEVRKIDNGYIRRESKYSDDGDYDCKESYSQHNPGFESSPRAERATVSDSSLKGAFNHLGRK